VAITPEKITIAGFRRLFNEIVRQKESIPVPALLRNPSDLLERAKLYGIQYKNGSWGWCSNVWHRSAANTVVIDREEDLLPAHQELMLSVLEHILCRPMFQTDRTLGTSRSPAKMRARLYCDPQFPDIPYRWGELNFPGEPDAEPDAELFMIPQFLCNPNIPGTDQMLRVIRFPNHRYTICTVSSYQGEVKKAILSHWIHFVYQKGGTG